MQSPAMLLLVCSTAVLFMLTLVTLLFIFRIIIFNRKSIIIAARRPLFSSIYLMGCTLTAFTRGLIAFLTVSNIGNQFVLWLASRCTLYFGHFTLVALRMWILHYDLHQTRKREQNRLKELLHLDEAAHNGPFIPWKCSPRIQVIDPSHYGNVRSMWIILSLCFSLLLFTVTMQIKHLDAEAIEMGALLVYGVAILVRLRRLYPRNGLKRTMADDWYVVDGRTNRFLSIPHYGTFTVFLSISVHSADTH